MAKKRIGILGDGNVGGALARGLKRAGHDVRSAGNEKAAVRDAAKWAEVVIMAVPFTAIDDVVRNVGDLLTGKTVIDATNALDKDRNLALGFTTSGAEELQKKIPRARVVKAFNTVFAQWMESGRIGGEPLAAFVAGDDQEAKRTTLDLTRDIGFEPVDAGPLRNARLLEPMAYFVIQLAYGQGMGPGFGLKLVKTESRQPAP